MHACVTIMVCALSRSKNAYTMQAPQFSPLNMHVTRHAFHRVCLSATSFCSPLNVQMLGIKQSTIKHGAFRYACPMPRMQPILILTS